MPHSGAWACALGKTNSLSDPSATCVLFHYSIWFIWFDTIIFSYVKPKIENILTLFLKLTRLSQIKTAPVSWIDLVSLFEVGYAASRIQCAQNVLSFYFCDLWRMTSESSAQFSAKTVWEISTRKKKISDRTGQSRRPETSFHSGSKLTTSSGWPDFYFRSDQPVWVPEHWVSMPEQREQDLDRFAKTTGSRTARRASRASGPESGPSARPCPGIWALARWSLPAWTRPPKFRSNLDPFCRFENDFWMSIYGLTKIISNQ